MKVGGVADELEPRIDALYALPLERFTPERDALAKELAADGDRPGADRVKALRKPVVAAWAVNALAREDPEGIRALMSSGTPSGRPIAERCRAGTSSRSARRPRSDVSS